jgi:hypothetical protein
MAKWKISSLVVVVIAAACSRSAPNMPTRWPDETEFERVASAPQIARTDRYLRYIRTQVANPFREGFDLDREELATETTSLVVVHALGDDLPSQGRRFEAVRGDSVVAGAEPASDLGQLARP